MKNLSSKQLKEISGGGRIAESIGYGIGIGLACIGDSKCATRKLNKLSNKK
ncbi:bacteriocin [Staphylococcus pseudintermedius]|uniref:Bacteriocin n=1 Tax=Staphylococcus pseudintermedius TaxID=283734 RepID=A0A7T7SXC6_STAPS|nr:bacteriocin [Staphylococcus pseudintermedius]QQM98504.1 bacteriocin [Staphylococcus pseudintermedius]